LLTKAHALSDIAQGTLTLIHLLPSPEQHCGSLVGSTAAYVSSLLRCTRTETSNLSFSS
jgi:hypothetical protein